MKADLEQLKDFILNTQTMAEQGECLMLNVTDILNEIERLQALTIPVVGKSFTVKQIVELLEEEETLDDAKLFFKLQE